MLHGHIVELGTECQTAKGLLFLGLYPHVSSQLDRISLHFHLFLHVLISSSVILT
jgi:hypothetical protein